jgi:hypothetical protein
MRPGNGGVAPVTRQRGKFRQIIMRYACNQRLRSAFYHWPGSAYRKMIAAAPSIIIFAKMDTATAERCPEWPIVYSLCGSNAAQRKLL